MEKKLTLVTASSNGVRISEFMYLNVHPDGKVRVTMDTISDMFWKHGISLHRGQTVTIGC